jgi:hypothetical protein
MAFARKWTDSTGKYTVEADFVDFRDDNVRLKKDNGDTISLPIEKLSRDDQEFVTQQAKALELNTPKTKPSQTAGAEREALEKTIKGKSVEELAGLIKNRPAGVSVEKVVAEIWRSLSAEFPRDKFTCSTNLGAIKRQLPAAIKDNEPFIVAFAPKRVSGDGRWSWTTQFRELAGQPVTLEKMSPRICKPNGDTYSFGYGDHKMTSTVTVQPYGQGSYDWWCNGDFAGASVTLDYELVQSETHLTTGK